MSDEKYISTCVLVGACVGATLLAGAAIKGCERETARRMHEQTLEYGAGIKVMLPIYIKGTTTNASVAIERQP